MCVYTLFFNIEDKIHFSKESRLIIYLLSTKGDLSANERGSMESEIYARDPTKKRERGRRETEREGERKRRRRRMIKEK